MEVNDDDQEPSYTSLIYSTFKQIISRVEMFSPALHTGLINRGNYHKPELLNPKYRVMGWDSDFYHEDSSAFSNVPTFPNQRCVEVKKTRPGFDCRCGILRRNPMDPFASVLGTLPNDGKGPRMPAMEAVIGGLTTEPNEYPWQVGVKVLDGFPHCGGSILTSKSILTAGHCLEWYETIEVPIQKPSGEIVIQEIQYLFKIVPEDVKVLVSGHEWPKEDHDEFSVSTIHIHPGWNPANIVGGGDFAILTLSEEIIFHPAAQPICLPSLAGEDYEGVGGIATGWGISLSPPYTASTTFDDLFPDKLQEANMTTMSNDLCHKYWLTPIQYGLQLSDDMICAKGDDQYVCNGDSGGPLVVQEPCGHYALIGATSFGLDGCVNPLEETRFPASILPFSAHDIVIQRGYWPAVFSRVTTVLRWIRENLRGESCPAPSILVSS